MLTLTHYPSDAVFVRAALVGLGRNPDEVGPHAFHNPTTASSSLDWYAPISIAPVLPIGRGHCRRLSKRVPATSCRGRSHVTTSPSIGGRSFHCMGKWRSDMRKARRRMRVGDPIATTRPYTSKNDPSYQQELAVVNIGAFVRALRAVRRERRLKDRAKKSRAGQRHH